MTDPVRVAFIGLGRMGVPMSLRLAAAGLDLVGYDLSAPARTGAAEAGLRTAGTLAGAADGAAMVFLMLPSSEEVASVAAQASLRRQVRPGALVVDMSSSQPVRTREVAASLAEDGLRMIDAPVSGGVSGARKGVLTIMAGGAAADVAVARPYLEHLGRVVHAGPIGCGHAVKALNNLLSATHLWATSEAMIAGERFGVDPKTMLSIFNTSSGRSGSTDNKWPNFILPGTFDSGFGLRLMVKDMRIAVELASRLGAPSVLGGRALALWQEAASDLPPDADHTEVARWLQKEARQNGASEQ